MPRDEVTPADERPEAVGAVTDLPVRRILIVDDNRDAADIEARFLESLGQRVERAYDGPSAIRIATEFRPDMVLLDLDMPGMNGFDVARHLSACDWMDQARLIAYTAFGQPRYRSAAISAGFDDFLMKPVPMTLLIALLRSFPPAAKSAASPTGV